MPRDVSGNLVTISGRRIKPETLERMKRESREYQKQSRRASIREHRERIENPDCHKLYRWDADALELEREALADRVERFVEQFGEQP